MTRSKSMTDQELFALIREADPPAESYPPAAADTEGERVLSEILACDRSEPARDVPPRRHRRRLSLEAASGVGLAGGAAATALALFAGPAPALAEEHGFVLDYSLALPGHNGLGEQLQSAPEIIAVLPAGASGATVHNADGTTTPLAAEDGIVAAIEQHAATITYRAGGAEVSLQVGPQSASTPGTFRLPNAWSPPANSSTATPPAGATGGNAPAEP